MGKVIQQVNISEDKVLYICDFDNETNIIKFRVSLEPNYLQEEEIVIEGNTIRTALYFFDIAFLQKFINSNL